MAAIVSKLLRWYRENARDLPWRRTTDAYAIYVSEIMLQQTQVQTVIPYWDRWMRELPDIRSLAEADPVQLHKLWEGLGYYTRVRNMQSAAKMVMDRHHGEFPASYDDVLALPGIGRYTAGAICSIAFNQPTPILDGNVMRVLTRLYGILNNPRERGTNEQLWSLALALVTAAELGSPRNRRPCSHLNQALMELGALVCTPKNPRCDDCPLQRNCLALQRDQVSSIPALPARPAVTKRKFYAFVLEHRGRFLVRQRPAGVVNAHLWEFPNVELNGKPLAAREALTRCNGAAIRLEPFCSIQHTITRYRISVSVYRGLMEPQAQRPEAGRWLKLDQMLQLPFSSAHKRILLKLGRPDTAESGLAPDK